MLRAAIQAFAVVAIGALLAALLMVALDVPGLGG
jgi:hypothetical protein